MCYEVLLYIDIDFVLYKVYILWIKKVSFYIIRVEIKMLFFNNIVFLFGVLNFKFG